MKYSVDPDWSQLIWFSDFKKCIEFLKGYVQCVLLVEYRRFYTSSNLQNYFEAPRQQKHRPVCVSIQSDQCLYIHSLERKKILNLLHANFLYSR